LGGLLVLSAEWLTDQRFAGRSCSPTGFTNSAVFPPQKPEDFRGFQTGWLIAQVATFGEKGPGESHFRVSLRLHIRQPTRENRGKPAPHGEDIRRGDWLVQAEVA
jgi:hypothetical protein